MILKETHTMLMKLKMIDDLKQRIIDTLGWMIKDMTWRADETMRNYEDGSCGGYSPELQNAIDLLKELKGE